MWAAVAIWVVQQYNNFPKVMIVFQLVIKSTAGSSKFGEFPMIMFMSDERRCGKGQRGQDDYSFYKTKRERKCFGEAIYNYRVPLVSRR